jgi:hypothetical protein
LKFIPGKLQTKRKVKVFELPDVQFGQSIEKLLPLRFQKKHSIFLRHEVGIQDVIYLTVDSIILQKTYANLSNLENKFASNHQ